jgi:hypothetical protein
MNELTSLLERLLFLMVVQWTMLEDSLGDKESSTMERLRDGQVKLTAARYEQDADSQRRIVNQIKTDTVSHHTLLNVLDKRALMGVSRVQG